MVGGVVGGVVVGGVVVGGVVVGGVVVGGVDGGVLCVVTVGGGVVVSTGGGVVVVVVHGTAAPPNIPVIVSCALMSLVPPRLAGVPAWRSTWKKQFGTATLSVNGPPALKTPPLLAKSPCGNEKLAVLVT